ncbi:hypothetical protein FOA43_001828 [Brettanomyces nanus]|uniref:RING-type E3 ubiquitin transferase n=1 Tax=Eeniella nana TaxID=13502 RepID=A0A875S0K5_EENNA|nr:uncharacterized protein FOA43_001828 [Brettanomyces nanus]QPG74498.1 hypothetical protein FOA43_001828 [Brettanomyces nanus]
MSEAARRPFNKRGGKSNRDRKPHNRPVKASNSESTSSLSDWRRNEVDLETEKALKMKKSTDSEDTSTNICVVCANSIKIAALSPCNHVVCHICGFRQRALYEKKQCLVCRTDADQMIFTDDPPKSHHYDDVPRDSIVSSNQKYAVEFTSFEAKNGTLGLLEFRCPVASCKGISFPSFKKLNEHVRELHNKVYCPVCSKFKKAFICELKTYSTRELQMHQIKGTNDEEGFTGHPTCKFCGGKRFYSEDELYIHMRERHERCHVCDQIDASHPNYFRDYKDLFQHFQDAHFICTVQSCLDKKFVVFRDEFDLQAHMIKEHSEIYGSDRLILRGNEFGTRLSTLRDDAPPHPQSSGDSREVKKMRLEERARHYLHYSQTDFAKFQEVNREYDEERLTALELLDNYKQIFGSRKPNEEEESVDYGTLIYEFSRLYPSNSLQRKQLEAINSNRMRQERLEEKFPELPGLNSSSSFVGNNWGSRGKMRQGSLQINETFPSLPAAPAMRFRSELRMGRSSSWAPPVNAATIPGYFPSKASTSRSSSHSSSRSSSVTSLPAAKKSPTPSASSSSQSLSSLLGGSRTFVHIGTSNTASTYRMASAHLDERKFPKLPEIKARTRKPITRVKPVNNSIGQWGSHQNDAFETRSPRVSSDNSSKKGKKGKVVFHIGVGN